MQVKIRQLQNSLKAEIQIEFSRHLPWDLDLQACWAPVWQGLQKPCQPGVGSTCRQWGKPGWLLSLQTDMFWHSFSCTEFIFFQWKEKVSLGNFQPAPYPTTLIARPLEGIVGICPFCSTVMLICPGVEQFFFPTNSEALCLQFFCILTFFQVHAVLPAVREWDNINTIIPSSVLLHSLPLSFFPSVFVQLQRKSLLSCFCQGGSSLSACQIYPLIATKSVCSKEGKTEMHNLQLWEDISH